MSTPPFTRVGVSFGVATPAASGIVVQATYTVPAGKRARMIHSYLEIVANAAAAATLVNCFVTVTNGSPIGRVHRITGVGAAQLVADAQQMDIWLEPGTVVTLSTQNTSAVIVTMTGVLTFEEWG